MSWTTKRHHMQNNHFIPVSITIAINSKSTAVNQTRSVRPMYISSIRIICLIINKVPRVSFIFIPTWSTVSSLPATQRLQPHPPPAPARLRSQCPAGLPWTPSPRSDCPDSPPGGWPAPFPVAGHYTVAPRRSCPACSCRGPGSTGILVVARGPRGRSLIVGGRLLAVRGGHWILSGPLVGSVRIADETTRRCFGSVHTQA